MDLDQVESTKKIEDELKEVENEESSLSKKKIELQVNEEQKEEEKDEAMENSQAEDPLNLSPENLELAQKILSIELILIKILENLPTKSLISFRLVNKRWEKEAANIMTKGLRTCWWFIFDTELEAAVVIDTKKKLRDLNECMRKSGGFPCSFLKLGSIPLDDPDLVEFFTLHGSTVQRLQFYFYDLQELAKLGHLLLDKMPNVHNLKIYGGCQEENSPTPFRLFPENSARTLPHLKSFTYSNNFPIVSEIIRASPNLERVYIRNFSLHGIDVLASMNKIHLLKKVLIDNDRQNIAILELLANGCSRIEKIALRSNGQTESSDEFLNRRFVNALSKILDSSKKTLNFVDIRLDENFLTGVKWPRLEKVRYVVLTPGTGNENMKIPPNFIADFFPNIQKLVNCGMFVPFILNSKTPLDQLQDFQTIDFTKGNLDNLAAFAPNLRKLELDWVENLNATTNSLWACSGLKQLEIKMFPANNSFPQLDMAFTGLSEEVVRKLHADPHYFNEMKINKEEIPRVAPSILDCPGLTALTIRIYGFTNDEPSIPLMTAVSGEFGFKMLENLKVDIAANEGILPSLESLKPYAHLSKC